MMLKRVLLVLLLPLLLGAAASAQSPLRLLVLPFDAADVADNYGLGLAAGIQRAFNSLEGVFVPSLGDAALLTGRLADISGTDELLGSLVELFSADAVVSGSVAPAGSELEVTVALSGPRFPEGKQVKNTVPAVSSTVMRTTVETIIQELGMSVDSTVQTRLDTLTGQAPSASALGPVGLATARLPAGTAELQAALETDAGSGWMQSEYARALMLAGNAEEALAASERALELNPDDTEALLNHGIILTRLGQPAEAAAAYDRILELNSWHATALTGRALVRPDDSGAVRSLERAVDAAPRMAEAWLELVALAPDEGRARQLLRRATTHLPESVQLHRSFMRRTLAAGSPQAALDYLRQTAARPLAASPALYSLALELPDGVAEEALALAREGRSAFPDSSLPGLAEAQLLRRAGRTDEALTALTALRTEWPDDAEVTNQLAITLATAGRTSEARELFESVSGSSGAVQVNLAQLLLQEGQAA